MDCTSPNPFTDDVFVDHAGNLPGVAQIHHGTFTKLIEAVASAAGSGAELESSATAGRTFLVSAPRAGYGKSHLVARLRDETAHQATTLMLPFQPSRSASWSVALDSFVVQLSRGNADDDPFTEIGRHFLALMVRSALDTGAVERDHFPTHPNRLDDDYAVLFSKKAPDNLVDWTNERCDHLAHCFGEGESPTAGTRGAEARFWARLFLDREYGDHTVTERLTGSPEGDARSRCLQLLRITASLRPAMVIVDGLDGFFSSDTAGMEIARVVAGIRDEVPRSLTVLCLNEDVWDSVFGDKLPSAFLDRFTGETSKLNPITPEAAESMIVQRLRRIDVPIAAAKKFADRLASAHLWVDIESKLTPRGVLRQARALWSEAGDDYFGDTSNPPEPDNGHVYEVPLTELTDKADFFADLQKNGLRDQKRKEPTPAEPAFTAVSPEPEPENPFFAVPPEPEKLDGIESIIRDIRGSGSSVTSEPAETRERVATRPVPKIQAGPIEIKPKQNGASPHHQQSAPEPTIQTEESPPVTRQTIDDLIQRRHRELLGGPMLKLDLVRLGKFLKAVGENHPGLAQSEEHHPGAQSASLRWKVHGQSVLLGFESPQNVYFWNTLLQQSLSSNEREKIAAFSHGSQSFDRELFATFGFSPAVIQGRIDPIEMSDQELALLYAAESVLGEFRGSGDEATAMQHITQQLDPLWRRIGQTV